MAETFVLKTCFHHFRSGNWNRQNWLKLASFFGLSIYFEHWLLFQKWIQFIHLNIHTCNIRTIKNACIWDDTSGSHFITAQQTRRTNPILPKGKSRKKVWCDFDEWRTFARSTYILRQKNQATNVTRITFVSTLSHIGAHTHTHTKFTIHKSKMTLEHKMERRTRENYDDRELPKTRFQLYVTSGWVGECERALEQSFIILFARFRHFGKR